jgi:hypothetical protein
LAKQARPTEREVLGDGFGRGSRRVTFAQIIERNPARNRSDATVPGYQDRLLSELANFRGLAQSFERLTGYARQEYKEAKRSRLLDLANRFKRERDNRRLQNWKNRIRTNEIARVLGLRPEFDPEEPPVEEEDWWRISKLREWYANQIKKRTPTPYAEIRVYVFTRKPLDSMYSDRSLLDALDAVEVWLTTGLASYDVAHASEREEIDEDELAQENSHQGRGGGDDAIREDQMWYYIAFWKMPNLREPEFEYYGKVLLRGGQWRATEPKKVKGRKPSFGTPFVSSWIPPSRGSRR